MLDAGESLTIREATAADFAAVYDLICDMEATRLPRGACRNIYLHQLADPFHLYVVADDGGAVVGELHLRMEEQFHHAGMVAEIMELAVAAGHRDRRIGARLVSRARVLARSAGCVSFEVACNQRRVDAHRFYERQGLAKTHFKLTMDLGGRDDEPGLA